MNFILCLLEPTCALLLSICWSHLTKINISKSIITYSVLISYCFALHPYEKHELIKPEWVIGVLFTATLRMSANVHGMFLRQVGLISNGKLQF